MKKYFFILIVFCSCGPSAQDVAKEIKAIEAAEKHHLDSIGREQARIEDSIYHIQNLTEDERAQRSADSTANALLDQAASE